MNFSSYNPSISESDTLALGKGFIPTPKDKSIGTVLHSFDQFARGLRLKHFFGSAPSTAANSRFRIRNTHWDPRSSEDWPLYQPETKQLERYINDTRNSLLSSLNSQLTQHELLRFHHQNTHKRFYSSIRSLRSNPDTFVKLLDKGLGFVLTTKTWYREQARSHLQMPVYSQVQPDDMPDITASISGELSTLCRRALEARIIDQQTSDFITKLHPPGKAHIPKFYLLVKGHKDPVKGRPVAGAHSWVTTAASMWVGSQLQLIVDLLPQILKSSDELLAKLKTLVLPKSNLWLFSADIVSMYPNIRHKLGKTAVKAAFIATGVHADNIPLRDFIIELMCIVLQNNYVQFQDDFSRQEQGTAMGTNLAVAYANIVGWYVERFPTQLFRRKEPGKGKLLSYDRFVDDSFGIIHGSRSDVLDFIDLLNSRDSDIQFTFEISHLQLDILDLTVMVDDSGSIQYKPYWKSISTFQYCVFASFHRLASKTAWITSELGRFKNHSSRWIFFLEARDFFYDNLRLRGYRANFLDPLFKSVDFNKTPPPSDIANPKPTCILNVHWTPRFKDIDLGKVLAKHKDCLPSTLKDIRFIVAYSRTQNLSDLLTSSRTW